MRQLCTVIRSPLWLLFYGRTNSFFLACPCNIICSNPLIILVAASTELVPSFSSSRIGTKSLCCLKWYQPVGARGCVKGSVALNFVKQISCEGMPVKSSSSLRVRWTPLSGVDALQGSFSDRLLLDGPWGVFNVWYKIYLFEDTWCYMYAMFWLSREIQQYTEITTRAKYSNCNISLDHCAKVIAITGLYLPTVRMLGIPSSLRRNMWDKASSSLLLSSGFLLLVVQFLYFVLGWATYTPFPPLVRLAGEDITLY